MGLEKKVLHCNAIEVDEVTKKKAKFLEKYGFNENAKKKRRTIRSINELYYIRYQKKLR